MTSPTRKQIIDAYDALENLESTIRWENIGKPGKEAIAFWKNTILAALPPKPQPTMAEIEWDDEKHYLAEAENPNWGKVIMLHESFFDGFINVLVGAGCSRKLPAEHLTLTGRRYTPTEVQE